MFAALRGKASIAWVLLWGLATIGTLIGAGLVEFRYFILPWTFWRLHAGRTVNGAVNRWVETVWFATINVVTIFIFLNWGFEWEKEKGAVQRFMW